MKSVQNALNICMQLALELLSLYLVSLLALLAACGTVLDLAPLVLGSLQLIWVCGSLAADPSRIQSRPWPGTKRLSKEGVAVPALLTLRPLFSGSEGVEGVASLS